MCVSTGKQPIVERTVDGVVLEPSNTCSASTLARRRVGRSGVSPGLGDGGCHGPCAVVARSGRCSQ